MIEKNAVPYSSGYTHLTKTLKKYARSGCDKESFWSILLTSDLKSKGGHYRNNP
jgi:hypothetical protein